MQQLRTKMARLHFSLGQYKMARMLLEGMSATMLTVEALMLLAQVCEKAEDKK
jgi:Tfp pilus assembly protein PilF